MIDCLTGGGRGHFQEFSVKRQFANVFIFRSSSFFSIFLAIPSRPFPVDVGGKEGKGGGGGGSPFLGTRVKSLFFPSSSTLRCHHLFWAVTRTCIYVVL